MVNIEIFSREVVKDAEAGEHQRVEFLANSCFSIETKMQVLPAT
jgi:hypothetical protein